MLTTVIMMNEHERLVNMTSADLAREVVEARQARGMSLPLPWLVVSRVQGLHSSHGTREEAEAARRACYESGQYQECHGVAVVFWPEAVGALNAR
jgi:hypothetical protein